MALTCNLRPLLDWLYTDTDDFGNAVQDRQSYEDAVDALASGTSSQQANIMYKARRTITTASTNDDLDLAGGVTDAFGQTLTFTAIKALLVRNRSTTEGDELTVGGAGAGAITSLFKGSTTNKITVETDGCLLLTAPLAGYAVTATTADLLRITHSGTSSTMTYDIIIIGVGTAA